jgi:hypothetical protein
MFRKEKAANGSGDQSSGPFFGPIIGAKIKRKSKKRQVGPLDRLPAGRLLTS